MDFGPWGNVAVLVGVAAATTMITTTVSSQSESLSWLRIPQLKGPFERLSKSESSRPKRKRALTLPLPDPTPDSFWSRTQKSEQQTHSQDQCLFLNKLPFEIRMMIYEKVIGDRHYHLSIVENQGRVNSLFINSYECQQDPKFIVDSVHSTSCRQVSKNKPLALLSTCRTIYSEAIPLLYTTNSFEFTQSICFQTFVYALPHHRFQSLRTLKFYVQIPKHPLEDAHTWSDWKDLWQYFADDLGHLRNLIVKLGIPSNVARVVRREAKSKAEWLMPAVQAATVLMKRELSEQQDGLQATRHVIRLVIPSGTDGQMLSQERSKAPTEVQSADIDLVEALKRIKAKHETQPGDALSSRTTGTVRPGLLRRGSGGLFGSSRSTSTIKSTRNGFLGCIEEDEGEQLLACQKLTCEHLHAQVQQSLYNYRPYGHLYGGEDDD